MKQFFGGMVIAGLVVGCLCVIADGAFAKGPNPVRPYRARTQEIQVSLGMCDPGVPSLPGFVSEEWSGEGNTTHGGRSLDDSCITITGVHTPMPLVLEFAGKGSGIVANGDMVFFGIANGLTDIDAGCLATFTIQFAGGTGRFEQASGAADCVSARTTPCGPAQKTTCTGSIKY